MIGEIRDPETAKYTIQAAQTGHLVFSTLHINDAPSAIVRLLEMGMEPYLVASTVHLIIAQRLVRRICPWCKSEIPATPEENRYLKTSSIEINATYKGRGCSECLNSGYKGRIGIFENFSVTPDIQELVIEKKSTQKIRDLAIEQGMVTLKNAGLKLILNSNAASRNKHPGSSIFLSNTS